MTAAKPRKITDYAALPAPKGYASFIRDIGPLLCDRYALTMTYAAWKLGFVEDRQTVSNVFCRSKLNNGDTYKASGSDEITNVKIPYLVSAGQGLVAEWLDGWKWRQRDLRHLAQQKVADADGNMIRLFPDEFLDWLSRQKITLDIKAVPEGQLVFPQEPVMQLSGPWWQQMMVEGAILSLISSSTNLATIASQVKLAATRQALGAGAELVEASAKEYATLAEMSLRRSPSIGAIQSARAAQIAGWNNTSNDYAGMCYGAPVMGTFAHAWVMLHDTEEQAFENWAKAFPGATVFLVDTYNTVEGVKTAIRICQKHGLKLKGIRLDSGNMGWLSKEVQPLLEEAGFGDAVKLGTDRVSVRAAASLYGRVATDVTDRESYITGFGIGSEVAVNQNNPLLDFVLKLSARLPDTHADKEQAIRDLIKLSESEKKTTLPGIIDVVRYLDKDGKYAGDTIIPADLDIGEGTLNRDLYSENIENGKVKPFPKGAPFIRLLQPWMKKGQMVQPAYKNRDAHGILAASRETCADAIGRLDKSHLRLSPDLPHDYGVGLAEELAAKRRAAVGHIHARGQMDKQRDRFPLHAA